MTGKCYSHQLDAKNRMRLPAKFREELGDNYTITVGTGGCLYVHTKQQMDKLKATFKNINPFREDQLRSARVFMSTSLDVEEDKQGRFVLTDYLRKFANIVKNIVIFNGPTCIEIWAEEVWTDYCNSINFDNLATAFDPSTND